MCKKIWKKMLRKTILSHFNQYFQSKVLSSLHHIMKENCVCVCGEGEVVTFQCFNTGFCFLLLCMLETPVEKL